jgi:dolichyl-phosphate beta-glucosyltransferase
MPNGVYLSVIIPAYNEEKRLPKTLGEIDRYLKTQNYDYEIVVVNDGSKDGTVKVAKDLMPKIKNLKVTGYEKNQGKGYAVRFGMLKAKGEYRLFTDADNSTSIEQIEKMWPYFKGTCSEPAEGGYDIVIGSRDVKGAILDPPQPPIRRFVGEGFKFLRKIIVGLWRIEDSQCGFKCFTKGAAENIFLKCKINRFAFDPEILIIAKKLGYKIKEIPVLWKNDLESKVKLKSTIKMLIDLFKIRWNLIKGIYGQ